MSMTHTPELDDKSPAQARISLPLRLRVLDSVDDIGANLALVVIVIASVWAVLARYVTHGASEWTIELIAAAFSWMVFLGAAAVHKRRALIGIDSLVVLFPPALRFWIDKAAILVTMAFSATAAALGLTLSLDTFSVPMGVSIIPLAVPYLGLACGMAIICIRSGLWLLNGTGEART